MAGRALIVFLPTGSKAEAQEARRALRDLDRTLVMCTLGAHPAGQTLHGDVVVIGSVPAAVQQDATGEVTEVESIAGLEAFAAVLAGTAVKADEIVEPEPGPTTSEQPSPETAATQEDEGKPAADPLEGKSRVEMIQEAARRWPGARRWATLTNEELAAAFKELEASD